MTCRSVPKINIQGAIMELTNTLKNLVLRNNQVVQAGVEDIDPYNSIWIMTLKQMLDKLKVLSDNTLYTHIGSGTEWLWHCERKIVIQYPDGPKKFVGYGDNSIKKKSLAYACYLIIEKIPPTVQMENENSEKTNDITFGDFESDPTADVTLQSSVSDMAGPDQHVVAVEETVGGVVNQIATKAANTIITTDKTRAANSPRQTIHSNFIQISSSEPSHTFPSIQNRWTPLARYDLQAGAYFNLNLFPVDMLLQSRSCAISTLPFETFAYVDLSCQLMFKINANKFQSGRYVAAVFKDPVDALLYGQSTSTSPSLSAINLLPAEHVLIDVNSCQDTILNVPFIYPRTFNRPVAAVGGNPGYQFGQYAMVRIGTLDPLKIGGSGNNSVKLTIFIRLKDINFAAMVPRINLSSTRLHGEHRTMPMVQMENYSAMIKTLDGVFKQVGVGPSQDKPSVVDSTIIVPRAVHMFSTGRGYSHADKLVIDGEKLTSYYPDHNDEDAPTSMIQFAQIWGKQSDFTFTPDTVEDTVVFETNLDPFFVSSSTNNTMLPIQYASAMFALWSGTQEFRFDFISTNFHTATLSVTFEYGRPLPDDACGGFSSYNKTIHLSEQKSFTITAPYIFETVYRRTQTLPFLSQAVFSQSTAFDVAAHNRFGLLQGSFAKMVVRIVNPLRPITNVNPEVRCLVFRRAGRNFDLKYPIGSNAYIGQTVTNNPNNFPFNYSTPTVQMEYDTGDKETLDETKDFNSGVNGRSIQTTGDHTHFYTLLRKPVIFISHRLVGTTNQGSASYNNQSVYCIPVQPLCAGFYGTNLGPDNNSGGELAYLSRTSPMAMVCNLFRHWRGSLRYTFFVDFGANLSDNLLYIYHIPHTGVRMIGTRIITSGLETNIENARLGTCGLPFTVVSRNVNPVVTIEVPFSCENNWQRTYVNDPNAQEYWGEKGMFNSGHLLLQPEVGQTCKITVSIEAGADFKLHGFNPIFSYQTPAKLDGVTLTDQRGPNVPTVQMMSDFTKEVTGIINNARNIPLKTLGIGAVTAVAPTIGIACTVASANNTLDNVNLKLNSFDEKTDKITTAMDEVLKSVQSILNPISAFLNTTCDVSSILMDCVFEFCHVLTSPTITTLTISVVNILRKLGFITLDFLTTITASITQVFEYLWKRTSIQTQSDDETQQWQRAIEGFCGLLVGAISVAIGFEYKGSFVSNLKGLFKLAPSFWSITVNATRFFKDTFVFIKRIILSMFGYVSPEVTALNFFKEKSEFVSQFINDAQDFLNEVNAPLYKNNPHWRVQGWTTMMNACVIQKQLALVQPEIRSMTAVLGRIATDVIKRSNEMSCDMTACPVRYEPFVLAIEGGSGIGKSFLTSDLIVHMLKDIGFTSMSLDVMFVKNPGPEFWNGIGDQPVIVYDDWMASSDPTVENPQLMELMCLKSTATFNPNIAQLEQKSKRINPQIIVLLTNQAYPQVTQSMRTPSAVYRRRDMVWRVQKKKEFLTVSTPQIDDNILDSFDHLEFSQFKDVTNFNGGMVNSEPISYTNFKNVVCEAHKIYNVREKRNVRRRLDTLQQLLPENAQRYNYDQDPFSVFYATQLQIADNPRLNQNSYLPSEQLTEQIVAFLDNLESINTPSMQFDLPSWDGIKNFVNKQYDYLVKSIFDTRVVSGFNTPFEFIICMMRRLYNEIQDHSHIELSEQLWHGCNVCLDSEVEAKYLCVNCITDPHRVCEGCYDGLMQASRDMNVPFRCPVCRNERMIPTVSPRSFSIYKNLMRSVANLVNYSDKVKYVNEWLLSRGTLPIQIIETIIVHRVLCSLINTILFGSGPFTTGFSYLHVNGSEYVFSTPCSGWQQIWISNYLATYATAGYRYGFNLLFWMAGWDNGHIPNRLPTQALVQVDSDDFSDTTDATMDVIVPINGVEWFDPHLSLMTVPQNWVHILNSAAEHPMTQLTCTNGLINDMIHDVNWRNLQTCFSYTPNLQVEVSSIPGVCLHEVMFQFPRDVYWANNAWVLRGLTVFPNDTVVSDSPCNVPGCIFGFNCVQYLWRAIFTKTPGYAAVQTRLNLPNHEILLVNGNVPLWCFPPSPQVQRFVTAQNETRALAMQSNNFILNILQTINNKFGKYFQLIVGSITVFGFIYASYKTCKALYSFFFPAQTLNAQLTYDPGSRPRFMGRNGLEIIRSTARVGAQIGSSAGESCEKKMLSNSGFIEARDGNGAIIKTMRFLGLRGKHAILPNHYVTYLSHNIHLKLFLIPVHSPAMVRPYVFSSSDFIQSTTTDAAFFKLPAHYPNFSDIVKFIPTIEQWRSLAISRNITVLEAHHKKVSVAHNIISHSVEFDVNIRGLDGSTIVAANCLKYNLSKSGLCGAGVCIESGTTPLVAMHVAGIGEGYSGIGYAVLLSRDDLEWMPKCSPPTIKVVADAVPNVQLIQDSQVVYYGKAMNPVHINNRTKIVPSLIQDDLKHYLTKYPAILSARDPDYEHEITPLVAGISKHGKLVNHIPTKTILYVREFMNEYLSVLKPLRTPIGKLGVKEAIVGFSNLEYYEPLMLMTSSGYPWASGSKTTKEHYIKFERNENLQPIGCAISQTLTKRLSDNEVTRLQGKCVDIIYTDSLKDELKDKDKRLKIGKTRVFCASPIDHTIEIRQYYLDFIAAYMQSRLKMNHAVGVDPDSQEWGNIFSQLKGDRVHKFAKKYLCYDYSNFGPGFSAQIAEVALDAIADWYNNYFPNKQDTKIRNILKYELINSCHIANDCIYQQFGGSPSGSSITTILNSLVNLGYIFLVFVESCFRQEIPPLYSTFTRMLCPFVYGDDVVISFLDHCFSFDFTIKDFQYAFDKYGIGVTNPFKDGDIQYCIWDRITFLKRRFQPTYFGDFECILAPIDVQSIQNCALWILKTPDTIEATRENARAALVLAFGHGPAYYNKLRGEINVALTKKNIEPIVTQWEVLYQSKFKTPSFISDVQ